MVSLLLDIIDISFDTLKNVAMRNKSIINELDVLKKEAVEEIKKAEKIFNVKPSTMFKSEIIKLANGDSRKEEYYMKLANNTSKYISYALYYISEPGAKLISLDLDEQKLVNGIVDYICCTFGCIYTTTEKDDITKYDIINAGLEYSGKFLLYSKDIDIFKTDSYMNKVRLRWKELNNIPDSVDSKDNKVIDQNQVYNSAFTVNNYMVDEDNNKPTQPDNMPGDLFQLFESKLHNIVKDRKHYYEKDAAGNWHIAFPNGKDLSRPIYLIEDGRVMGGTDLYLLATYRRLDSTNNHILDTVFVNVNKHPDIINNMINTNGMYILSDDEAAAAISDMFIDGRIYRNIDFSNTGFLDNITDSDRTKLQKALCAVIQVLECNARLRFANYLDPENFTLVSDDKVAAPLSSNGWNSDEILDGLTFVISGNIITKTVGGNGTKYQF